MTDRAAEDAAGIDGGDWRANASDTIDVFRTSGGETWARFDTGRRHETCPADSQAVRLFLTWISARNSGRPASPAAVTRTMALLSAEAMFGDSVREVHSRVAAHEQAIYIDLADESGSAIEVTASGWTIVRCPPVYFRRDVGQLPLPLPSERGSWEALDALIHVPDDEQRGLARAWLVGSMWPTGPYAILNLVGEHGAAKSTTTRTVRQLIDPSSVPLRKPPKDVRDLFVSAKRSRVLALDNLSHLDEWLSDALCCIATGGGYATRTLYENDAETLFSAMNPVVLNGIGNVAVRGDLLDRMITLNLMPFEGRRLTEAMLRARLNHAHPRVLAAIVEALSCALRRRDEVEAATENLPRMADFTLTVEAAAPALGWDQGAFTRAYEVNRSETTDAQLEASPVAEALLELLAQSGGEWEGTAGHLLVALETGRSVVSRRHDSEWPRTPKALSDTLTRLAGALRARGVSIQRRKSNDHRLLTVRQTDPGETDPGETEP